MDANTDHSSDSTNAANPGSTEPDIYPFAGNFELLTILQSASNAGLLLNPTLAQIVPRLLDPILLESSCSLETNGRRDARCKSKQQISCQVLSDTEICDGRGAENFESRSHAKQSHLDTAIQKDQTAEVMLGQTLEEKGINDSEIDCKTEIVDFKGVKIAQNEMGLQTNEIQQTLPKNNGFISCIPTKFSGRVTQHWSATSTEKKKTELTGSLQNFNDVTDTVSFAPKSDSNYLFSPLMNQTGTTNKTYKPRTANNIGVPTPATPTRFTAPVHIDVGGTLYTSSLESLTRYPNSHLGQMFNGSVPIVLDTMKQHYFIDRDGALFRHVLNFLRTGRINLDSNYDELYQLIEETEFYGLDEMLTKLHELIKKRYITKSHENNRKRKKVNRETQMFDDLQGKQNLYYESTTLNEALIKDVQGKHMNNCDPFLQTLSNNTTFVINEPNKNNQRICAWLEVKYGTSNSGSFITTRLPNEHLTKCIDAVHKYVSETCQCDGTEIHKRCTENEQECMWHYLSKGEQLHVCEILLQHGFEFIVPYPNSTSRRDLDKMVYLLQWNRFVIACDWINHSPDSCAHNRNTT